MCSIPGCVSVETLQVPSSPEARVSHLQMKGAFNSVFFMFHEALNVCGRQEIRHILIGNYIRMLND